MDNRNRSNFWQQHGFTLPQPNDEYHYHYIDNGSIPVFRDPVSDATTSSFLFWDYDPTFCPNIAQTVSNNFTGPHCIVPLSQIPDSSSNFANLTVRQMIKTAATPIYSNCHPCAAKDFTTPLATKFSSEQSYSLLSFDTSNGRPPPAISHQSVTRTTLPQVPQTIAEQLCQVCLAATSNGLHFGAKTCAACAAFFRRTVSDDKSYTCKRSQRCDVKLNHVSGYRKICRSCRMKRCLHIGMLRESIHSSSSNFLSSDFVNHSKIIVS